jgi:hypothetical protein
VKSVAEHPALSHVDSTQVPFLAMETISCQSAKPKPTHFVQMFCILLKVCSC